jgi:hypothetical protein
MEIPGQDPGLWLRDAGKGLHLAWDHTGSSCPFLLQHPTSTHLPGIPQYFTLILLLPGQIYLFKAPKFPNFFFLLSSMALNQSFKPL